MLALRIVDSYVITQLVIHTILGGKLSKCDVIIQQHLFIINIEEICKKYKVVVELYYIHQVRAMVKRITK